MSFYTRPAPAEHVEYSDVRGHMCEGPDNKLYNLMAGDKICLKKRTVVIDALDSVLIDLETVNGYYIYVKKGKEKALKVTEHDEPYIDSLWSAVEVLKKVDEYVKGRGIRKAEEFKKSLETCVALLELQKIWERQEKVRVRENEQSR